MSFSLIRTLWEEKRLARRSKRFVILCLWRGADDFLRGIGVFIVSICQGVWVGPLHISRGRRLKKGGLGGSLEQVVVRISLVVNVKIIK